MYPLPAPREPSCNAIRALRAPRAPPPPRVRPLWNLGSEGGSHFLCHRAISPSPWSPPPIPSREDGTSTEARRNQWNRQRPRAVRSGAAWSTPPARARVIFFLKASRRERRVAPAALRLPGLARAVRPDRLGLWTTPQFGLRACTRARPPFLSFAASSSSASSSQYIGYWDWSEFGILLISKGANSLPPECWEGAGGGDTEEGVPGKQETLALSARLAFVCSLPPPSNLLPSPGRWGDERPRASVWRPLKPSKRGVESDSSVYLKKERKDFILNPGSAEADIHCPWDLTPTPAPATGFFLFFSFS